MNKTTCQIWIFGLAIMLGACSPSAGSSSQNPMTEQELPTHLSPDFPVLATVHSEQATFSVVQITDQLQGPWGLAFLPGGDFLITQKGGQLVRVNAHTGAHTQIPGVPVPLVLGQGGLLDLVLAPDFEESRLIWFSYAEGTRKQNHTSIARARFAENELRDITVIFRANSHNKQGGLHFGSRLVFDEDGYLFASIGEGSRYKEEAQNPHTHLGSIIRINPDGSIPADNPFANGKEGANEVWSYGHRNPQGLTLHPVTKELWSSEHGPKGGDEVNLIERGGNYGWPKATFGRNYSGTTISKFSMLPGMISPLLHWTPSIAPSGLAFYQGDYFPQWKGDLFSGALAGQQLRRIELKDGKVVAQEKLLLDLAQRIRDVRNGPDGYLYMLTDDGYLLKLQPA